MRGIYAWPHTQLPGGAAVAWRCLPLCTATRTADRQLQRSDGEPQLAGAEQCDQGFSHSRIRGGNAQHLRGGGGVNRAELMLEGRGCAAPMGGGIASNDKAGEVCMSLHWECKWGLGEPMLP